MGAERLGDYRDASGSVLERARPSWEVELACQMVGGGVGSASFVHRSSFIARLAGCADVHLLYVDQLNTYDVLVSDQVLFTTAALDAFLAGPATGKSVKAVATESEAAE